MNLNHRDSLYSKHVLNAQVYDGSAPESETILLEAFENLFNFRKCAEGKATATGGGGESGIYLDCVSLFFFQADGNGSLSRRAGVDRQTDGDSERQTERKRIVDTQTERESEC